MGGRIGVVTGASRGIGRSIAIHLAAAGAHVVAAARSRPDLDLLCAQIGDSGGSAVPLVVDLSSRKDLYELRDSVGVVVGRHVDFLVNNAGIMHTGSLDELSEEEWDSTIAVNQTAPVFCTKYLLPYLRRSPDARIVNVASVHALAGFADRLAYTASKGAIVALTRQMAIQYAPERITVNAVCPGAVRTHINEHMFEDPTYEGKLTSAIPLGRLGTEDDVAAAVLYLCSPAARYVTGQVITIDGGWTAA
jgi:NAD(P)-dependent dehydrogenase (short-subunit alcohol dehydrogenase family)